MPPSDNAPLYAFQNFVFLTLTTILHFNYEFYEKYFNEKSGFFHQALDMLTKLSSAAKGLTLTISQLKQSSGKFI